MMPASQHGLAAKKAAERLRGRWLMMLAHPTPALRLSPVGLVQAAASAGNRPLLRLSLYRILTAVPDTEPEQAEAVLALLARSLSTDEVNARTTLAWLLDLHTQHRRVSAFSDSIAAVHETFFNDETGSYPFAGPARRGPG